MGQKWAKSRARGEYYYSSRLTPAITYLFRLRLRDRLSGGLFSRSSGFGFFAFGGLFPGDEAGRLRFLRVPTSTLFDSVDQSASFSKIILTEV